MIQSIKINLNKTTFTLNNEAYSLLNDYVRALKECFKQEPEIIQDIEARIAELLTIELEATQSEFVGEKEVQKVIGAVGSIEELAKSFRNENKNEFTQFNEKYYTTDKQRPKLRRSVFNQNLGGVCSGFAYYLNVDVSFIRIAFVFTFLFFGTGILAYLILWVVIPRAKNEEIDLIIAHENNYSNRLYRSRDTKAIGGVCSALALHFGIEIWIVRLAFVVSVVFWGSGILIYLISWIIIPKASGITANFQSERKQDQIIENENQVAIIKNIFLGLIAVLGVGMIGLLIVFFFFSAGVFSFFDNSNLYEFLKMALPFDEGFKGLIAGIGLCVFVPILMLLVFVLKFIFKANISFRYAGSGLVLLFFVGIGLIVYGSIVSLPNKIEFRDNKKLTEQNINKNDSIYFIFNEINTGKMVDNFQFNEFSIQLCDSGFFIPIEYELIKTLEPKSSVAVFCSSNEVKTIQELGFDFNLGNDTVVFPTHFFVHKNEKYKFQYLNIKFYLRENTNFYANETAIKSFDLLENKNNNWYYSSSFELNEGIEENETELDRKAEQIERKAEEIERKAQELERKADELNRKADEKRRELESNL